MNNIEVRIVVDDSKYYRLQQSIEDAELNVKLQDNSIEQIIQLFNFGMLHEQNFEPNIDETKEIMAEYCTDAITQIQLKLDEDEQERQDVHHQEESLYDDMCKMFDSMRGNTA